MLAEMQPFADLIEKETKLRGEFILVHGMPAMISDFRDNKMQMAVLHGVEYGWLRDKVKETRPLLVAVQDTLRPKIEILVQKDSPVRMLADLRGKRFAEPKRPQPLSVFYLERATHQDIGKFFARESLNNAEDAIEAVIDGTADFTAIGNVSWDVYQDRKPGRAKRLRVLEESPEFPASVIVYNELESNEENQKKFRDNLVNADKTREGRQTLNLWHISGFQDVPKDYEQEVDAIVKRYPYEEK
jgi:ABC-type phosphate/phosphonate transport system substrate-binding protein